MYIFIVFAEGKTNSIEIIIIISRCPSRLYFCENNFFYSIRLNAWYSVITTKIRTAFQVFSENRKLLKF